VNVLKTFRLTGSLTISDARKPTGCEAICQ